MFAVETIVENSLYAIKYIEDNDEFENNEFEDDESTQNEFRRLFKNWADPEYLEAFFEKHQDDLQKPIFSFISIEDAIYDTIEEASLLEAKLIEIANMGKEDATRNLQTLFKPLHKSDETKYPIPDFQQSKVYGNYYPSWLRVYAIRIEPNAYVVTGGGIKLVKRMSDREHLQTELDKLNLIKKYLIKEHIIDREDLVEFFEI